MLLLVLLKLPLQVRLQMIVIDFLRVNVPMPVSSPKVLIFVCIMSSLPPIQRKIACFMIFYVCSMLLMLLIMMLSMSMRKEPKN